MKYCMECGKHLIQETVPSGVFYGQSVVIERCPDAVGADLNRHHFEFVGYSRGKYNPFTGEKNATEGL